MHIFTSLLSGLLFGLGLVVSGMTQPAKIINFLDVTGAWDPSLGFVMGGALLVFGPTYFFITKRRERAVLGHVFDLPSKTEVTPRLVVGAVIFGAGWGLGGICPGPAITSLPTLAPNVLALSAGIIFGILMTWGAQTALADTGAPVPRADF